MANDGPHEPKGEEDGEEGTAEAKEMWVGWERNSTPDG
jgi:hypothetical protein